MEQLPAEKWFVVVRTYKTHRRVLAIESDEAIANKVYEAEAATLRDGDVGLYEMSKVRTLKVESGGYNRTRW